MSDRIAQRWSPEPAESIRTRTDPHVKLDRDERFSFSETSHVSKETLIRGNVEVSKIEQMRESLEKNQELLQVYQDREDALVLHYSNLLNELGRSSGNTADIAATSQRMHDELAALEKLKAPVERICEAVQKQLSKLIAAEDDN
ncbi:hypothetical protein BGZ80_001353 [Entomortierella chlamydospora]|uniref:Uncharacterized protein n=1 Tax=Entomortierella chlamydospora TaxID=101097 RepID=A0A9P6SXT3_9FUNG|nr:hypothetical protein BGZ80_001353 [Entomortierella chlamydospora]